MQQVTVYDTATGQILRTVVCQDSDVGGQAQAGQSVISGVCPHTNGYVANGAFVDAGAKPGPLYTFDYTAKQWTLPLATAQAAQIATLNAAYQNAIVQDVSYTSVAGVTKTYQADTTSQQNLLIATTGYNLAGATPAGFYWVAADNTQVPFALADLHGLYLAMLAQGATAFQHLQTQKAAVNAATTAAAALAVTW